MPLVTTVPRNASAILARARTVRLSGGGGGTDCPSSRAPTVTSSSAQRGQSVKSSIAAASASSAPRSTNIVVAPPPPPNAPARVALHASRPPAAAHAGNVRLAPASTVTSSARTVALLRALHVAYCSANAER